MTAFNHGAQSEPSAFESEHRLLPLGDDLEARAQRAEEIAAKALAIINDLTGGITPPNIVKIVRAKTDKQRILDSYREPNEVEMKKAWERIDAEEGAHDY